MIKTYRDLIAWQKGSDLFVLIYRLTKTFPKEEIYGISSQMRRASNSICSNIAEGFGRKAHKDREHFYIMALGSLRELESHTYLCMRVGLLSEVEFNSLRVVLEEESKILRAFIRKHESLIGPVANRA